jgi:GT2 family glycosyltransferase
MISFLLHTHNRDIFLEKTLFSLSQQQNKDFELLVAETANLDSTTDILKRYKKMFNIECYKLHLKFVDRTKTLNFLASKAKDIICILDSDVIKLSNYTQEIFEKVNDKIFLLQYVKRLDKQQTEIVKNSDIFDVKINIEGKSQIAVLKEKFLNVGGYDERFFCWGAEDNDLSNRLVRSGLTIQYANSIGLHQYHKNSYAFRTFKTDRTNRCYLHENDKKGVVKNIFFIDRKENKVDYNSDFERIF